MTLHRFAHEAMATVFEIRCAHSDAGYAAKAAHAAFAVVDRLEQVLSRFIGNSDVSRINHLALGEGTRVSPETMECLEIARRMYDLTAGAFDVSVGSGLPGLDLALDELMVRPLVAGVRLDLGGLGKGYAVDRAALVLEEWGISSALVHGGWSSVLATGPPTDGDGWPLTLSAPPPGEPRTLVRMSACQQAFSASGTRKGDHILDPRTGEPVRGRAVWVAVARGQAEGAPATVAEALSTAFMVLAREEIEGLCRRSRGVEAWLVEDQALVHLTAP